MSTIHDAIAEVGDQIYYAHAPHTVATLERLAALEPDLLACMHGSAHRGHGSALLGHLAQSLRAAVEQ
ncbi:MAG TPA: hypothetical protein RMG48_07445 [Myxococcales bacterium LLY-WYZ-16_1]|nr:hypothetical protein [Myxococcales bacterium LLY-WYZ-16_1]